MIQALDEILQGSGTGRLVEPPFVNIAAHQLQHHAGTAQRHFRVFVRNAGGPPDTLPEFLLPGQELFQAPDQPVHLAVKIRPGMDRGGVAIGQLLQAIRQIGLARHRGPADQQGHHGNATSQG